VLDVDRGHVDAGAAAQPMRRQFNLPGALQHHQVDVFSPQLVDRNFLCPRPIPAQQAARIGVLGGVDRDNIPMPTRDEGLRPRPMHMPHENRAGGVWRCHVGVVPGELTLKRSKISFRSLDCGFPPTF
jgi:hypothetical protein